MSSIFRRPTTRDQSRTPVSPTFSLDDFQRLVCDAFDLQRPPLSFSPAAPAHIHSSFSPAEVDVKSYFEYEPDLAEGRSARHLFASASASNSPPQTFALPRCPPSHSASNSQSLPRPRTRLRPRSQSFTHFNLIPTPTVAHMDAKQTQIPSRHSGGGVVPRVLRTLRTRASALVLRSSHFSSSSATTPPAHETATVAVQTDPVRSSTLTLTSTTSGSTITPKGRTSRVRSPQRREPYVSGSPDVTEEPLPTVSPSFTFPPRPAPAVSHSTLISRPGSTLQKQNIGPGEYSSSQRPRTTSLRPAVDSASAPRGSRERSLSLTSTPRELTRTATPINTHRIQIDASSPQGPHDSSSSPKTRIHTYLPPLAKAKSFGFLNMHGHMRKQSNTKPVNLVNEEELVSLGLGLNFKESEMDDRCPSPYKNPRAVPPVPDTPPFALPLDDDEKFDVPAYVFERRGSATSTCTQSSTRSTRTLTERLSHVLKLPRLRSRSKLNLSLVSNESSALSNSTNSGSSFGTDATTSSSSPGSRWGSLPPTPNTPSFVGYAYAGMGRVLSGFSATTCTESSDGSHLSLGSGLGLGLGLGWEDADTQDEARSIGRVLTPESDPFRKTDVSFTSSRSRSRSESVVAESFVSVVDMQSVTSGETTKSSPASNKSGGGHVLKRVPKVEKLWLGDEKVGGKARRVTDDSSSDASVSASGHAHTNSGDTITPLTVVFATGSKPRQVCPSPASARRSLQADTFEPLSLTSKKCALDERHRRGYVLESPLPAKDYAFPETSVPLPLSPIDSSYAFPPIPVPPSTISRGVSPRSSPTFLRSPLPTPPPLSSPKKSLAAVAYI